MCDREIDFAIFDSVSCLASSCSIPCAWLVWLRFVLLVFLFCWHVNLMSTLLRMLILT